MRGFIKNTNFNESITTDSDKRILDNLAGAGISADMSLFSNNLRNTSKIAATDYTFENNQFVITNQFMLPFANNTTVFYDNVEYMVKNSNLTNSFQLYSLDNLNAPFVPTSPYKDIIRYDRVEFQNIVNLNPERLPTKPSNDETLTGRTTYDPYTYYSINENIDAIVQSTEILEYKKSSAIITDRNNTVNSSLVVNGTIAITNTDANGNPIAEFNNETSPGMFVSNGTNKIRAFSDNSQPWEKVTGGLSTNSSNTNVKGLIMTNPSLTTIAVTEIPPETIDTSAKNVNYAIPVTVNGEVFYLLCKKVI